MEWNRKPLLERFNAKWIPEPNSGCWIWIAAVDGVGYGRIRIGTADDRIDGAHRISWMLFKGIIPDGLCVLHRCDTRLCVNPDHLFLGTFKENTQDMLRKNRIRPRRGEQHYRAKLTADQVLKIRVDPRKDGEIAADYGVWPSRIYDIKKGKGWTHI